MPTKKQYAELPKMTKREEAASDRALDKLGKKTGMYQVGKASGYKGEKDFLARKAAAEKAKK